MFAFYFPLLTEHEGNDFLNFAETREGKQRLADVKTFVGLDASRSEEQRDTSRTIIRATWLHLLPGVHRSSSNQLLLLGS